MARVTWTQTAQRQVRDIQLCVARDSPAAAASIVRQLRSNATRLAEYPAMGRTVPEYADPQIRELIVGPYRLVYRYTPEQNRVQVVNVSHASRRLPAEPDQP